ncbi:MAG TPA: aldo/keto reductase [Anaerolineales bacterium]
MCRESPGPIRHRLEIIHWPSASTPLAQTFRALNQLVREGRVRHLGVSNFDLALLKAAGGLAETPLLTNQLPYRLGDRAYARNGVLGFCQEHGILLTAYSPLDQGRLRPHKRLLAVAEAHSMTPYQIALVAWLVAQPRVITIPASRDTVHQRQNLEAAEILLTPHELSQLA